MSVQSATSYRLTCDVCGVPYSGWGELEFVLEGARNAYWWVRDDFEKIDESVEGDHYCNACSPVLDDDDVWVLR